MFTEQQRSQFEIKDFHEILNGDWRAYEEQVARHQYGVLWTYVLNGMLGIWLITAPHLLEYKSQPLAISDTLSGALVIMAEALSFSPRRYLLRWATPVVAVWLLFAPLIFWSPSPAVYLSDTLIASILIVSSVLVPGIPGRAGMDMAGPDQPPGWTYNPSSWIRRWLGIALSFLGFFIARYLAAYQLGYIHHAFDPFFGTSEKVLTSSISKAFPISDAGFGSVVYMLEALSGFLGDRDRWRTAPWIVVLFALLVLPLGATSITLVILQPVAVGAWCGLCLVAAVGLLTSVPLAVHEVIAMGQFLFYSRTQRKDMAKIFWSGGTIIGDGRQDPDRRSYSLKERYIASIQGVTVPAALIAQLAIGVWLMARPDIIHASQRTANCDHIMGALIVTTAAIATAEVTRSARFVNVLLGLLLIPAAFLFASAERTILVSDLLSGIALIVVSIPKGEIIEKYAAWNRFIR